MPVLTLPAIPAAPSLPIGSAISPPGTPTQLADDLGADNDTLAIIVNGNKILQSLGWEFTEGVFRQPSEFWIRFGWASVAAGLLQQFPKNSLWEIYVGSNRQATGKTDARKANQPAGGPTTVVIRGRDNLKRLHDAYVTAQVPVNVGTYAELVWYALGQVDLVTGKTVDPNVLRTDNVANRKIKTGVPITSILPHRTVQQILDDVGTAVTSVGSTQTTPVAKIGETWLRFINRYIHRAGLFLWSAQDGTFVLSAPDGNQPPSYQLLRFVDSTKRTGNIIGCDFDDDATHMHTAVVVYGRGGGKAVGRTKAKGFFQNQALLDEGFPPTPLVMKDRNVHSNAEAAFLARRKLGEELRDGFRIEYTISGCTLPFIPAGGNNRAVVNPDTVVAVVDEHLGLEGNFYVESVTRRRSPETTTTVRLMRVEDLIFGSPDEEDEG
jgi:hypothetical protein